MPMLSIVGVIITRPPYSVLRKTVRYAATLSEGRSVRQAYDKPRRNVNDRVDAEGSREVPVSLGLRVDAMYSKPIPCLASQCSDLGSVQS